MLQPFKNIFQQNKTLTLQHTGGGCMALEKQLTSGYTLWLTDRDAGIPSFTDTPSILCLYSPQDELGDHWVTLKEGTALECYQLMVNIDQDGDAA